MLGPLQLTCTQNHFKSLKLLRVTLSGAVRSGHSQEMHPARYHDIIRNKFRGNVGLGMEAAKQYA